MRLIRFLLSPLALLYGMGTEIRNLLYDKKLTRAFSFTVPVISVGNLTVGGSGKTPMIEYLIKILSPKYRIFVLSRGYKRKTGGFRIAGRDDRAETIGDEPYQIYRKWGSLCGVAVGEDRALAITEIMAGAPETDLILMDDAFQHRKVMPLMNILLSDFNRPFYNDLLMPAGNLRERRYHARRADMVVVTKCPQNLDAGRRKLIKEKISAYTDKNTPVYFAAVKYLNLKPVFNKERKTVRKIFAFSGIANSTPFMEFLRKNYEVQDFRNFPDHYNFTVQTIRKNIIKPYQRLGDPDIALVCTEKDAVRLIGNEKFEREMEGLPLYYLPVEMDFPDHEQGFIREIEDKLSAFKTQNGKTGAE